MNKENYSKFKKGIFIVGLISWILGWIILVFKLDLITYIGFMFYGLGLSGLTIYFTLKVIESTKEGKDE